jgi:hypothetical protein
MLTVLAKHTLRLNFAVRIKRRNFSSQSSISTAVDTFISSNIEPYLGDGSFLTGPTERTKALLATLAPLLEIERETGIVDVDPATPSTITAFPAGYIDSRLEIIKGLQTDRPLRRAIKPRGNIAATRVALAAFGRSLDPAVERAFPEDGAGAPATAAYTPTMLLARSCGLITGLPDEFGREGIIGDYRRLALLGADALIAGKEEDLAALSREETEEAILLREEARPRLARFQRAARPPSPALLLSRISKAQSPQGDQTVAHTTRAPPPPQLLPGWWQCWRVLLRPQEDWRRPGYLKQSAKAKKPGCVRLHCPPARPPARSLRRGRPPQ